MSENPRFSGFMRLSKLSRTMIHVPFIVLAGINLVGTYYVQNLYDFNTFVRAGKAIVTGSNPYTLPERLSTNLNPPITLFVFQFLAEPDTQFLYQVWRIISFILYIILVAVLARTYNNPVTPTHVVLAFCMTGIWYTLLMGQIYIFLLFLCLSAWLLLKSGNQVAAGIIIGLLAAIKPNFLVWPGLLLLSGGVPAAISSFGIAALISIIPLFAYGSTVYVQWIQMLAVYKAAPLATNMSIYGFTSRLGLPTLGIVLSFVLLVAIANFVWRRRPSILEVSGIAIVVSLLATQYAWVGYAVLLLPIYFSKELSPLLVVSALLLCMPSIVVFYIGRYSELAQIAIGMIYFSALVLILIELLRSFMRRVDAKEIEDKRLLSAI
jgi:hypothetical protein